MSIRASFRASDHLSMLLEHKNNLEHFGESTKPLMSLVYLHLFAVNLGASARCLEIVHSISNGTGHGYLELSHLIRRGDTHFRQSAFNLSRSLIQFRC